MADAPKVCELCEEPSGSGRPLRWRGPKYGGGRWRQLSHTACWENSLLPDVPCPAPGCRLREGHRFLHDIRAAS